ICKDKSIEDFTFFKNKMDLSKFKNGDFSKSSEIIEKQHRIEKPSMILVEISNANHLIKTFISNPKYLFLDSLPHYEPYKELVSFSRQIMKYIANKQQTEYDRILNKLLY